MIIGLVGKPNVGKSTFFKAATLGNVEIANYPFTTIQANQGVGYVRVDCPETDKKCGPKYGYCINRQRDKSTRSFSARYISEDCRAQREEGQSNRDT